MSDRRCTACKFYVEDKYSPRCSSPNTDSVKKGMMVGANIELAHCNIERSYEWCCGRKARWFEPKDETVSFEMPNFLKPKAPITWKVCVLAWMRRVHAKL